MHARNKLHRLNIPAYIVGILVFALVSLGSIFLVRSSVTAAGANCYDFATYPDAAAVKQCTDANPAKIYTMSPEDQVKSYLYAQAIRFCFAKAYLASGNGSKISGDGASSGEWFSGGNPVLNWTTEETDIGQIITGSQNQTIDCNEQDELINSAFSLWGWDKKQALCDMGWYRSSDPNPANCATTGSGDYIPSDNDGNAMASAFERALKRVVYGDNQYDLTPHQKYVLYRDTFIKGCAAVPLAAGAVSTGTVFTLDMVAGDGTVTPTRYEAKADGGNGKYVRILNDYSTQVMECGQLVDAANKGLDGQDYKGAFATFQKIAQASAGGIAGGSSTPANTEDDLCDKLGSSSLRWVMCPLFTMMDGATSWIRGAIEEILQVDMETYFGPAMKNAWTTFRNISLTLLVIAALVMVISQAAGFDMFDAYTVKKILPRLLIAIIGITLSWEILRFTVQFFNDIGDWTYTIITSAFSMDTANVPWTQDWGSAAAAGAGVALAGGAVAATGAGLFLLAVAPGGIGVILVTLALFLFSLLIGLFVLGLRLAIIGACIITAPLAIALYVLPGTKKGWEFWKDAFWTCMIIFPVMMAIMATCTALSSVIGATGTSWTSVMSLLVYFSQFILLGLAIQLVGGITKFIASAATDKTKSWTGSARKARSNMFGKVSRHHGDNVTEWRSKKLDHYQTMASREGRSNRWAKTASWAVGGGRYGNIEARMSAIRARENEEANKQIATGLDNERRALTVNRLAADRADAAVAAAAGGGDWEGELSRVQKGVKQYKTLGGAWVKSAEVDAAHRRWKGNTAAQQKSLSYEMNKASHEEDVQAIVARYRNLAQGEGGWGMTDFQAGGAWIGASYENQNKHRQLKSQDWKGGGFADVLADGSLDYTSAAAQGRMIKFVKDVHENIGAYPLSQMNSETVRQLRVANQYLNRGTAEGSEAARNIQGIAETTVHDMAAGGQGSPVYDGSGNVQGYQQTSTDPASPGSRDRIVSGNGAAATNEQIYGLAVDTGVKWQAPTPVSRPTTPPPVTTPPQKN